MLCDKHVLKIYVIYSIISGFAHFSISLYISSGHEDLLVFNDFITFLTSSNEISCFIILLNVFIFVFLSFGRDFKVDICFFIAWS